MAKREYTWYVEPLDNNTNSTLSQELPESNFGREKCEDDKKHPLWECPLDLIRALWKSKESLNLNFRVFNKEGKQGKRRDCTFMFIKKKKTAS